MIDRSETSDADYLKTRNTRPTIGFLLHMSGDAYGVSLWSGAVDAARANNVNLICFVGGHLERPVGSAEQDTNIYRLASAESVDGLVISSRWEVWDCC
jgi:DNA-binding LacI/PurR family transcriptional regulator